MNRDDLTAASANHPDFCRSSLNWCSRGFTRSRGSCPGLLRVEIGAGNPPIARRRERFTTGPHLLVVIHLRCLTAGEYYLIASATSCSKCSAVQRVGLCTNLIGRHAPAGSLSWLTSGAAVFVVDRQIMHGRSGLVWARWMVSLSPRCRSMIPRLSWCTDS
jgi:hypothetical protein